jgi:hypothetical protein
MPRYLRVRRSNGRDDVIVAPPEVQGDLAQWLRTLDPERLVPTTTYHWIPRAEIASALEEVTAEDAVEAGACERNVRQKPSVWDRSRNSLRKIATTTLIALAPGLPAGVVQLMRDFVFARPEVIVRVQSQPSSEREKDWMPNPWGAQVFRPQLASFRAELEAKLEWNLRPSEAKRGLLAFTSWYRADPTNPAPLLATAITQQQLGLGAEAEDTFTQVLRLCPPLQTTVENLRENPGSPVAHVIVSDADIALQATFGSPKILPT